MLGQVSGEMSWLINQIKKRPKMKKFFSCIIGETKRIYMFLVNTFIGINEHKAVFISFNGKSYSDNPKAISEKLHEMYPQFEQVWLFNNPEEKKDLLPSYIRAIENESWKALKELATAKFWIDNFCKPNYIYKNRKQIYIQTWHGDRGCKKVLYDTRTKLPNGHYKEGDLVEPKICDLMVSGSAYGDRVCKTAFGYDGEILKVGSPRNDQLIQNDPEKALTIKRSLNIGQNTKVLLYAPTFRDTKKCEPQDISTIDLLAVLQCLENKTGDQWICLIRSHVSSAGFNNVNEAGDRIRDVSDYEDMADLLLITDFFITDYSSSVGDFVLLKRPYVLFQPDKDNYVLNDRQFYFDFNASPYIVAFNNDELISKIISIDNEVAEKNANEILKFYDTVETGEASKKVVEYMINKLQ